MLTNLAISRLDAYTPIDSDNYLLVYASNKGITAKSRHRIDSFISLSYSLGYKMAWFNPFIKRETNRESIEKGYSNLLDCKGIDKGFPYGGVLEKGILDKAFFLIGAYIPPTIPHTFSISLFTILLLYFFLLAFLTYNGVGRNCS